MFFPTAKATSSPTLADAEDMRINKIRVCRIGPLHNSHGCCIKGHMSPRVKPVREGENPTASGKQLEKWHRPCLLPHHHITANSAPEMRTRSRHRFGPRFRADSRLELWIHPGRPGGKLGEAVWSGHG